MNPIQNAEPTVNVIGNLSAAMAFFEFLAMFVWLFIGWRALIALERISKQHGELSNSLRTIALDEE